MGSSWYISNCDFVCFQLVFLEAFRKCPNPACSLKVASIIFARNEKELICDIESSGLILSRFYLSRNARKLKVL